MNKKPNAKDPLSKLKQSLDKANNFVDYFLVCGVKPSICLNESLYEIDLETSVPKISLTPEILSKCPSFDKSLVSIDEGILNYCFLSEFKVLKCSKPPKEELYSFILDNNFFSIEYPQKYVTCLCFYESLSNYKTLKEKTTGRTGERKKTQMHSQSIVCLDSDTMSMSSEMRSSMISSTGLGTRLKNLYITKSICLVSIHPFINQHKNILKAIYKYYLMQSKVKIPIEKIILNLILEVPIPPRGLSTVEYQIINEKMILKRREFNKLPSVDFDISSIYLLFTTEQILAVFKHLLLETKVLFFSTRINNLLTIILGFLSFLYPMKYPFQIASYVPKQNYSIIESVSPYILGINEVYEEDFFDVNGLDLTGMSILVVDIDNKNVLLKTEETFPPLPKSIGKHLEKEVSSFISQAKGVTDIDKIASNNDAFIACFFKFIVSMLKTYSKFLNSEYYTSNENIQNTNINTLFKVNEYLQSFSSSDVPFYDKFVNEAQMFSDFIYKKMIPKDNKEKLEILFLDESIAETRWTLFSKNTNTFITSEEYKHHNSYIVPNSKEINEVEKNFLSIEANRKKSNEYSQEVLYSSNNNITFNYLLFPLLNQDLFCNEKSLTDYILLPSLLDDLESVNTDLVAKSNLNAVKVRCFEMKNYIYLNWLQLWAFSFWYFDLEEHQYRFDQLIDILDKVTHHEIEVFNLIFEALKQQDKEDMIIRLYQKLIIYKLNPSSYIYSIISKLMDKKQIQTLTQNPNTNFYYLEKGQKPTMRNRTMKIAIEDEVLGNEVKFYTIYVCPECQNELSLDKLCLDFEKMNREPIWAFCSPCDKYIYPKVRVRYGNELNIDQTIQGQTSTVDEVVLHNPYHLKLHIKEGIFREFGISLNLEEFKMRFTPLFWNSIWYFHLLELDYEFIIPYSEPKNKSTPIEPTTNEENPESSITTPPSQFIIKSSESKIVKKKGETKRKRYNQLSMSVRTFDNSFELSGKVIKIIGHCISFEEKNESSYTSEILDNTYCVIDTVSRYSDIDNESMFLQTCQKSILNKIEEENDNDPPTQLFKQDISSAFNRCSVIQESKIQQDQEISLENLKYLSISKDYQLQKNENNDNLCNDNSNQFSLEKIRKTSIKSRGKLSSLALNNHNEDITLQHSNSK